jgi:hypothetical protein
MGLRTASDIIKRVRNLTFSKNKIFFARYGRHKKGEIGHRAREKKQFRIDQICQ